MNKRATSGLEPGMTLDRYRLERRIGKGAFGEVWLAMDAGSHGFRKQVALKVLSKNNNDRRVQSFIREARICGALNHPNVIDVFGVGEDGDRPFIIMEYVEGETLSSLWGDLEFLNIRVPRSIIIDVGIAICEALHHAWTATNLKPANVLISNRGIVKLGDFGVAKLAPDVDDHKTRAGKLKGTPSYLAPELWRGDRNFRPGMDLWSLGIILWELAAGERFYKGARTLDIYKIIKKRSVDEEIAAIEEHVPTLAPIIRKLLQRDADERYQDALQVAAQLRWARMAQPVSGDLMQFSRLVRASRVSPEERSGSIASLPALPEWLLDWQPLLDIAAEDPTSHGVPSAVEEAPKPGKGAMLGPPSMPVGEIRPLRPASMPPAPPPEPADARKDLPGEEDATIDDDPESAPTKEPMAAVDPAAGPDAGNNPLNENPDSSDPGDGAPGKVDPFFGAETRTSLGETGPVINAAVMAETQPIGPAAAGVDFASTDLVAELPESESTPGETTTSKPRRPRRNGELAALKAQQQKLQRIAVGLGIALAVVTVALLAVLLTR
jgi:serine/threonine protein kinase